MSLKTLLKATTAYLDRKHRLTGAADALERTPLREALDEADRSLEFEVRRATDVVREEGAIRNIMVAVDSTETSEWAVNRAVRLAEDLGARITILHVVDLTPIGLPDVAIYDFDARRDLAENAAELTHKKAALVPHDLFAGEVYREGNVASQIVTAAAELEADLLVVGTHGRGLLGHFLLGSVAEAVVRYAPCPVLTVGRPFSATKRRVRAKLPKEGISAPAYASIEPLTEARNDLNTALQI
jgi:nucleotide-binding universal stress UspA family protein